MIIRVLERVGECATGVGAKGAGKDRIGVREPRLERADVLSEEEGRCGVKGEAGDHVLRRIDPV